MGAGFERCASSVAGASGSAGRVSSAAGAAASTGASCWTTGACAGGSAWRRSGSTVGPGTSTVSTCSTAAAGSCSISATATPLPEKWRRTSFSTLSSIELECVFFSVTPSEGNNSRISCEGTSSCRASSLMRILLIFGKLQYHRNAELNPRAPSPLSYQIHVRRLLKPAARRQINLWRDPKHGNRMRRFPGDPRSIRFA